MQRKHFFAVGMAISLATIFSCNKKDEQAQTTAAAIKGKWQIESIIEASHEDEMAYSDTTKGATADYFEFRSDGKLYARMNGEKDTLHYSIQSGSKIQIDDKAIDIQPLAGNSLQLYGRETVSIDPAIYSEVIIRLKK